MIYLYLVAVLTASWPQDVNWFQMFEHAVLVSSLMYTFLPPYEQFNDYPRFQGWYKFFLIFLQSVAVNGRGKVMQLYKQNGTPTVTQPTQGGGPTP